MSGCIALQELLFGQLGKEILDRKERKSFSAVDDILQRRLKDCLQVNNRFSAGQVPNLENQINIYNFPNDYIDSQTLCSGFEKSYRHLFIRIPCLLH